MTYDLKFTLSENAWKSNCKVYQDDSDTVFLGLLTIYVLILYLRTFSVSNA